MLKKVLVLALGLLISACIPRAEAGTYYHNYSGGYNNYRYHYDGYNNWYHRNEYRSRYRDYYRYGRGYDLYYRPRLNYTYCDIRPYVAKCSFRYGYRERYY